MDSVIDDIVACAEEVHEELGSGWTESIFHRAMEAELSSSGISFTSEGTIPVFYKGKPVGRRRPDLFVDGEDGTIIVELKSSSKSGEAQLCNYQDILHEDTNFDISGGVLIQFNEELEVSRS
jgi:GxxExxY protein